MIKLESVYKKRKSFELHDVSLSLDPGFIHIIVGRNGNGKSSLLKLIAGVIQADSGTISIQGMSVDKFKTEHTLSYMPDTFPFPMKGMVMDMMNKMADFKNFSTLNFKYYLQKFDIKITDDLKEMSDGQKQMLFFCLAMAKEADIYILDEPSRYIDLNNIKTFQAILQECIVDSKKTIVIATNSFEIFEPYADSVTLLDDGKVVLSLDSETLNSRVRFIKDSKLERMVSQDSLLWLNQQKDAGIIITDQIIGERVHGYFDVIQIMGGKYE